MLDLLTPVVNGFKREDLAGYTGPEMPSGAKVRQYTAMVEASEPGTPVVVGCAAVSAMQVYVAAAGLMYNRKAVVVVPRRKVRTPSTQWAAEHGAEIIETNVGYMSVVRARAREVAQVLGGAVRWDAKYAFLDNMAQVRNLPLEAERVIVPSGSGLTAAAVLAGVSTMHSPPRVVAVAVSPMADREAILGIAAKNGRYVQENLLEYIAPTTPYDRPHPNPSKITGMALDPYYAAKALTYKGERDVLWVSGRRPWKETADA